MKKFIRIIPLVFLFSSCAYHIGVMTSNPNFASPNHELSALAIGTASTEKVFGIGGLKKDALVLEAKKNLYAAYPLTKGQSYANMTVDFKNEFYFLYSKTTVTISADIMQINMADNQSVEYQPLFNQIRESQITFLKNINLTDTVKTYSSGTSHEYVVNKILPNNLYLLRSASGEVTKLKKVDRMSIFLVKDFKRDNLVLKINQEVRIQNAEGKQVAARLEALGMNEAIVKVSKGDKELHLKHKYDDMMVIID